MNPALTIRAGGPELLDEIEPLWMQLRAHHAGLSETWRQSLLQANFPDRRSKLIAKGARGLHVFLAAESGIVVAYCVCTVAANGQGEVDSIFVDEMHRGSGVGYHLMDLAMQWLMKMQASPIVVDVLAGNEGALRFYERFKFQARTVRLQLAD